MVGKVDLIQYGKIQKSDIKNMNAVFGSSVYLG